MPQIVGLDLVNDISRDLDDLCLTSCLEQKCGFKITSDTIFFSLIRRYLYDLLRRRKIPPHISLWLTGQAVSNVTNLLSYQSPPTNLENLREALQNSVRCLNTSSEVQQCLSELGLKLPAFSLCAIRGKRRVMEDTHAIIPDLGLLFNAGDPALTDKPYHPHMSFFAVYDGHCGKHAAEYAATQLHSLFYADYSNSPSAPETPPDIPTSLATSFERTHADFSELSKTEKYDSGTTAVVTVIHQSVLHVSWVGDSQALLLRKDVDEPQQLVQPHKPDDPNEKKRIEEQGGMVVWLGVWRVNAQLAVSRSLGDCRHQPYISCQPDCVSVPLKGDELCLILGCDGLFEACSPSKLASYVIGRFKELGDDSKRTMAEGLVTLARDQGSMDNISAIVVWL